MPTLNERSIAEESSKIMAELAKRIYIPTTPSSPPGLVEANTLDPWSAAGQYALGWTYLCVVLVFLITFTRIYHWWTDKLRQALFKEEMKKHAVAYSPDDDCYSMGNMATGRTADQLFPREPEKPNRPEYQSAASSITPINDTLALFRWIFYRPIPELKWKKHSLSFPSLAVTGTLII